MATRSPTRQTGLEATSQPVPTSQRSGVWRLLLVAAAVLAAAGVGWLVGRSGSSDTDGANGAPSTEMIETLDAWMDAVRAEDPFAIAELYIDDAVWHDEALDETFSGAFNGWNIFGMLTTVTDLEVEAMRGDTAVVRWTLSRPEDNNLTGLSVLTFDGGDIVAETVYYDCAQSPVADTRCANLR